MSTFHELLVKEVTESCLNDWNTLVDEHLKFIIELHSSCLGGVRPRSCQSSDNSFEESSYKEPKSEFRDYDPEEDLNAIFINDSSATTYGLNSEVWGSSDDEYGDEDRENTSDPWSKLGNVSDPWSTSSHSSSDDSNWNVDSNWANFDENFTGGAPSGTPTPTPTSSPSSAADTADRYYLFGGSRSIRSVTSDFSQVSIRDDRRRDAHFGGADLVNGGEWNTSAGENAATPDTSLEDSDGSFNLSSSFSCFDGGQEKDASEEMLDLESICGNTLAEKIANAENDIRSKDQIRMRGMQEQQCLPSDFLNSSNESGSVGNEESHAGGSDKADVASGPQEIVQTGDQGSETKVQGNGLLDEYYGTVGSPLADCLTENSVDFMTAENNSSSAESSVEFGDADNSLEFDDVVPNGSSSIVSSPGDDSVDSEVLPAVDSDVSTESAEVSNASVADSSSNIGSSRDVTADSSQSVILDDSRVTASDANSMYAETSRDTTASCDASQDVADTSVDASQDATIDSIDASRDTIADTSSSSALKADTVANNCNESGEVLCENVPTKDVSKLGDKCNNGATGLENDPTTTDAATVLQKTHSLANGDVADGDNLTNCDTEAEDASNGCSSNSEQLKENASSSIFTDPA